MSAPFGTFSDASTGRLQVTFSGTWRISNGDWAGPSSGAMWSLAIRCVVDDGASRQTAVIDVSSSSAVIELPYTAGTNVSVSMEYLSSNVPTSTGYIQASKLRIGCCLIKR